MNLLALLLAVQVQQTDVDVRLRHRAGLIDTLNAMACRPVVFVRVAPQYNGRGAHRAGEVWIGDARDEFALVHEFGHNLMVTTQPLYFAWADSMGRDPWNWETQEQFANAFVGAVSMLRHGEVLSKRKGEALLARQLLRKDLDTWCHQPYTGATQ